MKKMILNEKRVSSKKYDRKYKFYCNKTLRRRWDDGEEDEDEKEKEFLFFLREKRSIRRGTLIIDIFFLLVGRAWDSLKYLLIKKIRRGPEEVE